MTDTPTVKGFPDVRRIAVAIVEDIRHIRQFMETANDLRPFVDLAVMDDLTTIVGILERYDEALWK